MCCVKTRGQKTTSCDFEMETSKAAGDGSDRLRHGKVDRAFNPLLFFEDIYIKAKGFRKNNTSAIEKLKMRICKNAIDFTKFVASALPLFISTTTANWA